MAFREYLVSEVVADAEEGHLSRREALRRLGLFGVGLASATSLLAACADDDGDDGPAPPSSTTTSSSATSSTAEAPVEGKPETITYPGSSGEVTAAFASVAAPGAGLLVVHENRGLTPHFVDLVGRFAEQGYAALCPDLVSPEGGSAKLGESGVQAALAQAPVERLVGDLRAGIDELQRRAPSTKVGAVGFCFGGGMTWQLLQAGEQRLAAAAPFYGPAPEAPDFTRAKAAVLAVYAGLDQRVNASRDAIAAALDRAGLVHEIETFPDVDHAFFNDTGPRYDKAAADAAYADVLAWFERYLLS
jgi:carboxymethylenebutenolidase